MADPERRFGLAGKLATPGSFLTRRDLCPLEGIGVPCGAVPGLDVTSWPEGYDPVLSLAIIRVGESEKEEILVGVRAEGANRYHKNVVSVPTRRIRSSLWKDLFDRWRTATVVGPDPDLDLLVSELLSRKLGAGDWLENGGVPATTIRRIDFGHSLIGPGPDDTEALGMFGVEVTVDSNFEVHETASYSHLLWLGLDTFLELAATKNTLLLGEQAFGWEVCVHGLCMHSAAEIVRDTRESLVAELVEPASTR